MRASTWKSRIIQQMREVGTFRESFMPAVDALADILERRDSAYKDFIESGGEAVILRTSDRGSKSWAKNPRMAVWMELNTQALAYWKECGLTPSGLKKIDDGSMKPKKVNALAEALRELG